jgi:superfamily I DNA/RNA helicase
LPAIAVTVYNFTKILKSISTFKTLLAKDYLLIKGYPGTGKTTTIVSLIAILVNLNKKVLFTSFTNSAVDNLLVKIVEEVGVNFL